MRIEEIKLGNLAEFLSSVKFRQFKELPITEHRALSQIINPRGNPDDIVLIIAYDDNDQLLGYVGALPDIIIGSQKVAWNSCWYAHPLNGRTIALPLFYLFIKRWKGRIVMQDLTEHTTAIMHTLPYFDFIRKIKGSRVFFRFYFAELYPKKYIKSLLNGIDFLLNCAVFIQQLAWKIINPPLKNMTLTEVKEIDPQLENFITKHNKNELSQRGKKELEWIINYPWVVQKTDNNHNLIKKYYFSSVANSFSITPYKIIENQELIGFILIKERNRHITIPYVYFKEYNTLKIHNLLMRYLIKYKSLSLTWYNHRLCDHSKHSLFPGIYRTKIHKELVISKELTDLVTDNFEVQDGDGDVAFT
jgi:hypothetical protein